MQRELKKSKCLYCEIVNSPRQRFDWIFHINEHWVVGTRLNEDVLCIYRKHGEMPGGHNLNEIIDVLNGIKQKDERLEFEDTFHYRIWIRRK